MKKILTGVILVLVCAFGYRFFKSSDTKKEKIEGVVIEHSLGSVEIPKNPKRIVVSDFGILDMLDTMNCNVVGLPKDFLPEYLGKYNGENYINTGSLKEPNIEKIYEAKPDLIIITGRQRDFYEQLSKVAPTLFLETSSTDYIATLEKNIGILSQIFDNGKMLNESFEKIKDRANTIKEKVLNNKYNAIVLLAHEGKISSYGKGSRFSIVYDYLGFETTGEAPTGSHGNKITFEYLLEKNPDYIFVVDKGVVTASDILATKTFDNPIIASTKASQNGNIVYLDAVIWYTVSGGIRSTDMMLDEIENSIK